MSKKPHARLPNIIPLFEEPYTLEERQAVARQELAKLANLPAPKRGKPKLTFTNVPAEVILTRQFVILLACFAAYSAVLFCIVATTCH